jgi:hypothetical protein
MMFCQKDDLEKIAKALKIKSIHLKHKSDIVKAIENAAWKIQLSIYPARVIYRLIDL